MVCVIAENAPIAWVVQRKRHAQHAYLSTRTSRCYATAHSRSSIS